MLDLWLAGQAKQAEFAPGIPDRTARHPLPKVTSPETWQFGLHEHTSERAGHHFDLRLGHEPTGHAHSWAMRYWPKPGEARLATQQPTHSIPYMDFQGELISGYGKGKVRLARRDRTEVINSDRDHIRFNLYTGAGQEEYLLHRTEGDKWLLHNTTVTRDGKAAGLPSSKPKYKQKDPNHLDADDPTTIWQAKIDGSHVLYSFGRTGSQARVFSYRPTDRATGIIEHTHRLPDHTDMRVPGPLHDTVVRGELYAADHNGQALEPARVGGLLNSSVWKSRQKQEAEGKLRPVCFDVVRWRGRDVEHVPYAQKLEMLQQVVEQAPWLQLPRMAATPQAKRQLFEDIRQGKEPTTREGLVEWQLHESAAPSKAKFLDEKDVTVRRIFPERGSKRHGTMAGGFDFAYTKDGPVVGRVGTGFSHAMKRDMLARPHLYEGLTARILMQRTADRYAPRAPKFYGFHPDQELPADIKTAATTKAAVAGVLEVAGRLLAGPRIAQKKELVKLNMATLATLPDKLMLNRPVNPDKLILARDRLAAAAKRLVKKGAVTPVGQRVFGQIYKGITAPPLAARGRGLLNASRTATQTGLSNVAQRVATFKQEHPDVMGMLRNHPLAQHMDDHALVQNFLLSQKGTVHDTARSLGLMGGPSHSDMLRTVRQQQVGGAQQALGHMPTVANPMARQQLGAAPTVAGPRPVAPMQPPAMPKIGMDLWSYARAREKLAELAEDGEHKLQGHIDFQGLDIAVENRKGSVRSGKTSDGHEWHTKMKNDYGYIEAPAKGKDGDSIDCYVGPDKTAPTAYVVHQHKPDGTGHDEDKAMLAFPSKEEAVAAYLKHYDDPKFLGPVSAVPVDRLKEMVAKPTTIDKLSGVGMPMKLPTLGTPFNPTQNVKSLVQRWKAPTPTKPAVKLAPGSPKGAVA